MDTVKAFVNFKNKQKMHEIMLIGKSIYILKLYSIHHALR